MTTTEDLTDGIEDLALDCLAGLHKAGHGGSTRILDVSAAKNVVLTGGARAKHIFWQVAGQVTIHANAHFEGVILSQTGVTLQTTATMHGRALAQSLVAIDDDAITAP